MAASTLVRAELELRHGVKVVPKYVRTHSSVYRHVSRNLTIAGGGVRRTLNNQNISLRDRLKILYETKKVAPHPVAVHPRMPARHRESVLRAFLAMEQDEDSLRLLSKIPLRQAVQASLDDYIELKSMGLEQFYFE